MSKTIAPLLSFGASGQIAKTQVYATWKGRPYARRYVIPANPNTAEQQQTRSTFSWLNNVWKYFPSSALGGWEAYAKVSRFTAINGWIKQNLSALRGDADLTDLIVSPSAGGGIVAGGITATAGAGQLTIALTAPTLPVGWTIDRAFAAAIRQQDPQTGVLYTVTVGEDATTPYSIVLTGLTASQVYVVGGWFKFLKPDGSFAYGQAINTTGTPS